MTHWIGQCESVARGKPNGSSKEKGQEEGQAQGEEEEIVV
jgi:hypothetical protein